MINSYKKDTKETDIRVKNKGTTKSLKETMKERLKKNTESRDTDVNK